MSRSSAGRDLRDRRLPLLRILPRPELKAEMLGHEANDGIFANTALLSV
jgi:hypothetical protein